MNVPGNGQIPDPDSPEALGGEDAAVAENEVAGTPTSIANANEEGHQAGSLDLAVQKPLKAIVEALLFVSHEPLSLDRLLSVLGEVPKAEIEQTLHSLESDYEGEAHGVQLVQVAGGFRLLTRPDYAPWIRRLEKARGTTKLSRSSLETLAIIAYKQPIVRAEIEQIRGVETSGVLRTLLERKLVRMVGRKDMPGRPILYGTTKLFLERFGLRDLSQLPPLREFKELGEAQQSELPTGDDPLVIDVEGNGSGNGQSGSNPGSDPQESPTAVVCETAST